MQLDFIDAGALSDLPLCVEVRDECDSTNSVLLRESGVEPKLLVCETQTAGRGRRGSRWQSLAGDSLSFSMLWPFGISTVRLAGLPLVVGVACVRALKSLGLEGVRLKWPNDLLLAGAKLGGVLIELRPGTAQAVIGVGLNVRNAEAFQQAVEYPVADLAMLSAATPSRTVLLKAIALALIDALRSFEVSGFAAFRDEWLSYHAHTGLAVLLTDGNRRVQGVAQGVADDGALVLATAEGERIFHAGELSLRLAA